MNVNVDSLVSRRQAAWAKGLFWTWNIIFLAFILLGFAQVQIPALIQSIRDGVTPLIYLVYSLILIAIPPLIMLVGGLFLRKFPDRLFALGYVVEWPLLLILLFRFFLIREGNPAITVLLVWLAVAEAVFFWHLVDRWIDERRPFWIYLRLAGLTLLFSGTLYAAIWLAFYVPLVASLAYQMIRDTFQMFSDIIGNFQISRWYEIPLAILGYVLLLFSCTLILVMPVAGPLLAGRAWLRSLRRSLIIGGRVKALAATLLPLAITLTILFVSMGQPQHKAFQLLKTPPENIEQAQVLLKHEEEIRAGLLNAYLASFRYLSSMGEVRHVSSWYESMFRLSHEVSWKIEQAYENVIRPLLYVPVHPVAANQFDNRALVQEQQEAADLYQNFFDTPITHGERQTIVKAVRSNSNGAQAELAWQAVDDREVRLNRQEVQLTEHGDWAEVQIHEVYENQTSQRQEVVYYFSLPESAVVTGLWLGNSPDIEQAFAFQVTPRGAAQALYRNEVRYNRDPALIEQIGPRQYRLRAFPVEPWQWIPGSEKRKVAPELHLWISYRVLALDGAWPLPRLAEKRNVYWDGNTTRLLNGKHFEVSEADWLPETLTPNKPVEPVPHRVDFSGGQTVLAVQAEKVKTSALPDGLRLAVVLDRSFSMRERAGDVSQALQKLNQVKGTGPEPDVYLTSSQYRGESPQVTGLGELNPDNIFYFGGQNAAEVLAQFEALQAGKQYDTVLVLTDGSGYELGKGNIQIQVPDAPVWVIHLGGGLPLGYDDATLEVIQASGGGVAATVEEALARYAASRESPGQIDIVDGYAWQTLPTSEAGALAGTISTNQGITAAEDGFNALAARRVILSEMAKNQGKLDQLPILDELNQLAVDQGIVTPYSSMLVLVNESQQEMLKRLAERDDRYLREVENLGQTTQANPFAVTGVPEPEEWLLLGLAALLLAYAGRRKLVVKRPTL